MQIDAHTHIYICMGIGILAQYTINNRARHHVGSGREVEGDVLVYRVKVLKGVSCSATAAERNTSNTSSGDTEIDLDEWNSDDNGTVCDENDGEEEMSLRSGRKMTKPKLTSRKKNRATKAVVNSEQQQTQKQQQPPQSEWAFICVCSNLQIVN